MMPSQSQRAHTTRSAVMESAIRAFSARGDLGASLEEIAASAGVAKSTILYHFGSQRGLLRAVAVRIMEETEARIERNAQPGDPVAWAQAMLEEQTTPTARVLHLIGDTLASQHSLGQVDPLPYLVDRVASMSPHGDPRVIAAALLQFARSLAYGLTDPAEIGDLVSALQKGGELA